MRRLSNVALGSGRRNLTSFGQTLSLAINGVDARVNLKGKPRKRGPSKLRDMPPETVFDTLISSIQRKPIADAIEDVMGEYFDVDHIVLWLLQEAEESEILFSPSLQKEVPSGENLLSKVIGSKQVFVSYCQDADPDFKVGEDDAAIKGKSAVLMIPIFGDDGYMIGVIQMARSMTEPFMESDEIGAAYFMRKLSMYSTYAFGEQRHCGAVMAIVQAGEDDKAPVARVCELLSGFFLAKACVLARRVDETSVLLLRASGATQTVPIGDGGAVGQCMISGVTVNEKMLGELASFDPNIDGDGSDPGLYIMYVDEDKDTWVIGVTGRSTPPYFTPSDEVILASLAPFVVKALTSKGTLNPGTDAYVSLEQRLTVLLEIAEAFACVLEFDKLVPLIVERARDIVNAEKCILFMVEKATDEVVSASTEGLSAPITMKIAKGIVPQVIRTGENVKIDDCYNDLRFDRFVDQHGAERTTSILVLPIMNNQEEVIGVLEMANKRDGSFTEDNVRVLMSFNVFAGTALDNARLYEASGDLTYQLRTLTGMSSQEEINYEETLNEILDNAKRTVVGTRASMFEYDSNDDTLTVVASVGVRSVHGTSFAQDAVTAGESKLYTDKDVRLMSTTKRMTGLLEQMIADPVQTDSELESVLSDGPPRSSRSLRASAREGASSRFAKTMPMSTSGRTDDGMNVTICCIPLMNAERVILGVMEFVSYWKITTEHMKILECFSVFGAVILERKRLEEVAPMGQLESDLTRWISGFERRSCEKVPGQFSVTGDHLQHIWSINFDAHAWDGIGHTRVIFNVLHTFGICTEFNISNEQLFIVMWEIKNMYKKVPYHNWRHAVDTMQFLAYEISTSDLERRLTKFDIFGLLIAAICHDIDHDGFANIYNARAETPLGILYKNRSLMETHHCSVTISVFSKEDCDLFKHLEPDKKKVMWGLVLDLILGTDMARHFNIMKEFQDIGNGRKYALTDKNPDHKLLFMQLLLKSADISNISRPFDIADKWCDGLCEEFFRQGDIENTEGMHYTSTIDDRAHLDRYKSKLGFYKAVCLPLFQEIAFVAPGLKPTVDQVQANITIWTDEAEGII